MRVKKTTQWIAIASNLGVIAGIFLLIYEINQNAELVRVQMQATRAEAKSERQTILANEGYTATIWAKLFAAGFPEDRSSLDVLTPEERVRLRITIEGFKEAVGNWHFQCVRELLDLEICEAAYPYQARNLLIRANGAGIDFGNMRRSTIADLRRIAINEGLPVPNEDGTWPD